jgi:hypothetical protein
MLQTQTVVPELMELLRKIMSEKMFSDFNLVGGTALALQIGHRNSIDIDLFGISEINADLFVEKLSEFGKVKVVQSTKNIFITKINDIKVDFVNYKYPLLSKCLMVENIRMLSTKDIAAMKLNAISGRGSKKDFIDLYFLLNEFSLEEILSFYEEKYNDGSVFMVQKSLTYFEDANVQQQPIMFLDFEWENCKKTIIDQVKIL